MFRSRNEMKILIYARHFVVWKVYFNAITVPTADILRELLDIKVRLITWLIQR